MPIMASGKRSGRKIYGIIEQGLSNCLPREERLETLNKFLFSYQNCPHTTTKIPPSGLMFNQKVKFTILHIDNKINIDKVNNELEKNISTSKQHAKESHNKQHHARNISLQIGDRIMFKQRKLNKLTFMFEPTPYIVIETKGILIKAKEENSNCIVTRNIRSHFCRI